jgi:NitT/TauT family transport system substrate-binding protein
MKFEGGYVLEGTPKDATPAYQKMLLYIDAQTSQVRRALILDAQGNRNRFDFSAPVVNQAVPKGEFDFTANYALAHVVAIDAGEPITILAGEHLGCFELFASSGIRRVTDLKDKNVGVPSLGSSPHLFLSAIVAYVGLDPDKDIHWVVTSSIKPMELYADGKIDAFLGFPPEPQHLRAHNIGKVILNSAVDRPWSQYLCCMLAAHRDYVRRYPVATKRALRAIIKATDLCVSAPRRVAQQMVDGDFTAQYDYALQMLKELPYGKWR